MNRHSSALNNRDIVAIDGEGITDDEGIHHYVMMLSSSGYHVTNPEGLSTLECLEFIWHECQYKLAVGFGFGYDVNMLLKDLPFDAITDLYRGRFVNYGGFELSYRFRRSFTLRKRGFEHSLTVWDVHPFFQCSFVKALRSYSIECDIEIIERGKLHRGSFTFQQIEKEIFPYCAAEVLALKLLVSKFREYLKQAELQISRYDGAGAVAATLLTKYGVKAHLEETPLPVNIAAVCAYAGGRMECFQYGHTERDIHHYDINSAYPYAATKLPSLRQGAWQRTGAGAFPKSKEEFGIYRVRWDMEHSPIYPFFYRCPDMTIIYPQQGENWIWSPELYASQSFAGKVEVLDSWVFKPANNKRPFDFLNKLFAIRKEWKAKGEGAEKALKLGINSVYGKLAQQVGYNAATGKRPPFHQIEYAGWITSYTRAMLLTAAAQARGDIICCATDGIYSLSPLALEVGSDMGNWEYHLHKSMTLVQSGVYWYDRGADEQSYYRGFDKDSLIRSEILKAWEKGKTTYKAQSTRFVTMGAVVAGQHSQSEYRRWITSERSLALTMRNFDTKRIDTTLTPLNRGMVGTEAIPNLWLPEPSTPYPMRWVVHNAKEEAIDKDHDEAQV